MGLVLALLAGCGEATAARGEAWQGVVEFDERTLAFEVGGRVQTVSLTRGQTVEANAVAATLDDALARPARAARAADLDAARARESLVRAGPRPSDVRSLDAQIEGARAMESAASRNLARARSLASNGAVPGAQVDDLQAQYDRAHNERLALEERRATVRAGARSQEVLAAHAQVSAAEQALALEDLRLTRYTLRAPAAGTVLDVLVESGEVVSPGAPVATLGDPSHPYVDVFVPQARIGQVHVGARASVGVDALRGRLTGAVEDVARHTEFTPRYLFSERERPNLVVRVRVRVDDPQRQLHAGVPAFVTLEGVGP